MIPKSVNVLGQIFKVKLLSQDQMDQVTGTQNAAGLCDDYNQVIYLSKSENKFAVQRTFYHEVFHAICCVNGLNQTLDDRTAEILAQSFASYMSQDHKNARK